MSLAGPDESEVSTTRPSFSFLLFKINVTKYLFIYSCVSTCACIHMHHSIHVGVPSLLPPHGILRDRGQSSGGQAGDKCLFISQATLPAS